jgi:primosomal protein N' (replication factor Y)
MPYHDLRLIIVDEEHEASFKQEEGVIYHGRDMAVLRANIENIPIILASATPSIETMVNIKEGRFKHIKLRERYGDAVMPDIHIIDMRNEKLKYGNWISRSLKDMVASNLDSGKQSMLFLNRRGYAPLVLCTDCGHRINCNSCSTSLVYHQGKGHDYLQCHHCGFTCDMIKECPECKAKEDKIIKCGPGVERLRDEASELFPEARIAMLTSDTTANANKTSDLIKEITAGEYDIIIGTQMVAKGHHFPNLTLVGIVDADMEMSGGDPRTAERSYQILHQVAGRAGRESEKGTVLIQSYMPDSDILKSVMNYDRDRFIEHEIKMRKIRSMPPFSRLTLLIISGNNEIDVVSTARELSRHADFGNKFEIMGPIPAPLYQVQGKFRYHTLIKADRKLNIQKMIKHWISKIKIPNNVNIKVDIDPYNFI